MDEDLQRTPLHAAHVRLGAKMVPFGGWHMPVQYEGILAEHQTVRNAVGIFDVSHMGEVDFTGPKALEAVSRLVTNDVAKLDVGRALYTVACLPSGGIVDDCIVYRLAEQRYRIVVNASNIAKDVAHFREHTGDLGVDLEDRSEAFGLIAVQGPHAVALCDKLADGALADVPSFGLAETSLGGHSVTAARTGYTGEDGFELFVDAGNAESVWALLLEAGAKPIGLGARDTLRLEARLSLYGNDIDETTNPYEAGLGWVVKLDKAHDFIGREALRAVKSEGIGRKLVGFKVTSRGIVRPGAEVVSEGQPVGRVTSGGVAPTVGGAVGLAYVPKALAGPERELEIRQRGKSVSAVQVKGPFYRRP